MVTFICHLVSFRLCYWWSVSPLVCLFRSSLIRVYWNLPAGGGTPQSAGRSENSSSVSSAATGGSNMRHEQENVTSASRLYFWVGDDVDYQRQTETIRKYFVVAKSLTGLRTSSTETPDEHLTAAKCFPPRLLMLFLESSSVFYILSAKRETKQPFLLIKT